VVINGHTNQSVYFELDIINRVLQRLKSYFYFEAENIDFFNKIILSIFLKHLIYVLQEKEWGLESQKIYHRPYYRDAKSSFLQNTV
jgi:hypothetical protein